MKTLSIAFLILAASLTHLRADTTPTNCVPISGLVSWWPGESNALDVIDSNSGVLLNGATFAAGMVGQAFSFNGTAHVRIPDRANLHLTNALTIEAWVYPTNLGSYHEIVSKWDVVFVHQKSYTTTIHPNGRFMFSVCAKGDEGSGDSAILLSTNTIPANQWTHVAATYDGSTLRVYLNGVCENQSAFTSGIFAGTGDLGIGGVVGGGSTGQVVSPFAGRIDEPAIYSRTLSGAEIEAIYSAGAAGKCQPAPGISLGLYPGLTINGSAGQNVAIQYVTNVTSSNWVTITNLAVTQSSQLWIDTDNNVSTGNHSQRFYRAVLVP